VTVANWSLKQSLVIVVLQHQWHPCDLAEQFCLTFVTSSLSSYN